MFQTIKHAITIPEEFASQRLDQALAKLFPQYSRTRLKKWLESSQITVNNQLWKAKDKIAGGENIKIEATLEKEVEHEPENIALPIVYEDEDILVINKPAGMVVHPGAGIKKNTLLNALLHYSSQLKNLPRAGIIHRLDKDTSGLLIIAKTLPAYTRLVKNLEQHKISREYEAIIQGTLTGGGTIDEPIGRHPKHRIKMAVVETGKPAVTHYRIIKKFHDHTHIKVILETGRTHQIRVHLAHIHHPIIGDQVYAGRMKIPKGATKKLIETLKSFPRQALHAKKITLTHPITGELISWEVELPKDMKELLKLL